MATKGKPNLAQELAGLRAPQTGALGMARQADTTPPGSAAGGLVRRGIGFPAPMVAELARIADATNLATNNLVLIAAERFIADYDAGRVPAAQLRRRKRARPATK